MELISYDELTKRISEICKDRLFIERIIVDCSDKEKLLKSIFHNPIDDRIGDFKQIITNDVTIFEYETTNIINNKKTDTILVTSENGIIIKLDYHSNKEYSELVYSVYQEDSNRLTDRLSLKSYKTDDYEHLSVVVLGQFMNNATSGYYQKKYNLYIFDGSVNAIEINDVMYIKNEEGFNSVLRTYNDLVDKFSCKFNQRVDNLMGDNVQEYHIKRKKQEC